jgi:hypothetical protein
MWIVIVLAFNQRHDYERKYYGNIFTRFKRFLICGIFYKHEMHHLQ